MVERDVLTIDLDRRIEPQRKRAIGRSFSLGGRIARLALKKGVSISEIEEMAQKEGKDPKRIIRGLLDSSAHGRQVYYSGDWIKLGRFITGKSVKKRWSNMLPKKKAG